MAEPNLTASPGATGRLKVGWRIAIVFSAVTLLWLLVGAVAQVLWGAEYTRPAHLLRAVLIFILAVPMIVLARRFLDQRSTEGLGLTSLRVGWKPLLIGMLCWLLPALSGTIISVVLGWVEIKTDASPSELLLLTFWLAIMVFFYEALSEELIFRGYFYRNLAAHLPLWLAVSGQAVLFMLWGIFNGGENSVDRSLLFLTFALLVGMFRAITGSIWAGIGFHLVFQTFAQLFGSVGNQFTLSSPTVLMVVAFGLLPFIFCIPILRWFYKQHPNWHEAEPEPPLQTT